MKRCQPGSAVSRLMSCRYGCLGAVPTSANCKKSIHIVCDPLIPFPSRQPTICNRNGIDRVRMNNLRVSSHFENVLYAAHADDGQDARTVAVPHHCEIARNVKVWGDDCGGMRSELDLPLCLGTLGRSRGFG